MKCVNRGSSALAELPDMNKLIADHQKHAKEAIEIRDAIKIRAQPTDTTNKELIETRNLLIRMGDWMASVSSASVDALKQIDLALKNSISNKNGTTQLSPDKPAAKKQKNTESNTYAHKVASGPPASRYIPGLARPGIGQPSVSLKQTHSNVI